MPKHVWGDLSADSGNFLHIDGTSKCQHHFQNLQITTSTGGQLSFELSEMVSGDAQTSCEPFSEAITDLCHVTDNRDST